MGQPPTGDNNTLGISAQLDERPRRGFKEYLVDDSFVAQRERVDGSGDSEDDVKIRHRQQPLKPFGDPLRSPRCLAF